MASNAPRIDRLDKNYLINGNFDFWQRQVANDVRTGTGSSAYGADRWKVFPSSTTNQSAHTQRAASTNTGSQYDMNFGPFAANEKMGVAQIVEFANTKLLQGKEVTFAVTLKSDAASNLRLHLLAWTGTADSVTAFTNAVPYTNWSTYTLASNFTSIAVSNVVTTTGYVQYSVTGTVPTNCNNLVCIVSYDQNAGQQHYASQALLYIGSHSSPEFSMAGRNMTEELAMCQRYFEKSYNVSNAVGTNGDESGMWTWKCAQGNNLLRNTSGHFLVQKRAIPTISVYSYNGTLNQVSAETSTSNVGLTTLTPSRICEHTWQGIDVTAAILTNGNWYWFNWTADAEL